MATEVIMPALGMAQETGTLLEWLKADGEAVSKGEPIMLIETDKTSVEIEATADGKLANISAEVGDEVPVGTCIAFIVADGEEIPVAGPDQKEGESTSEADIEKAAASGNTVAMSEASSSDAQVTVGRVDTGLASPKARRLAAEAGVSLSGIKGSGPAGAIVCSDVATKHKRVASDSGPTSRIWKIMAERLTKSWQTVPHFFLSYEADVSNLDAHRSALAGPNGQKITVTDLLVKLTAEALDRHPQANASWRDETVTYNDGINIALAVAIEDGLQVPVIQGANTLDLSDIATRREELVSRARSNSLSFSDLSGGTFTISNLGMFGADAFCAIVNPPQAAILAVGKAEDKAVVVDGQIAIRKRMQLTLSCDHRVLDGATGAKFMQTLVSLIEAPAQLNEG